MKKVYLGNNQLTNCGPTNQRFYFDFLLPYYFTLNTRENKANCFQGDQ